MDLKPMGIGELIDMTFTLFRRAWQPLLLLGLISIIPTFLVQFAMQSIFTVNEGRFFENLVLSIARSPEPLLLFGVLTGYLLFILVLLFLAPLWTGAFIAAAHQVVMGESVTIGSAFRTALSRYWALVGTSLLIGLIYIVAFPVLVIGGLVILSPFTLTGGYLTLMTFFAFRKQVIVIERVSGGVPALKRSWQLVSGRFWPVLGTLLLLFLLFWVLGLIVGMFLNMPVGLLQSLVLQNQAGAFLVSVTSSLPQAVAGPLGVLATTMLYYDTRIRKEALDLQLQLDAPSPYPQ
jgi:hypothetical protein